MAQVPLVLVTGVSGFIGSWVAAGLLHLGYRVRGTVRSLTRKTEHLADLAPGSAHKLELVEADLLKPETWPAAVAGCTYILHVASPFMIETPKDVENELYKPAVEGTLSVLRAASEASPLPSRVVVTSSMASVAFGRDYPPTHKFTEADWTDLDSKKADVVPYIRSKTMAEKAAWDFVGKLPAEKRFELATVCPSTVFGPVLSKYDCASADVLKTFLERKLPMLARIELPAVDVRLVARTHILAMSHPGAAGHRFLVSPNGLPITVLGDALAAEFNNKGYSCPTTRMPNWLLHVAGWFDATAKTASSLLGKSAAMAAHAEVTSILGMTETDFHAAEMPQNIVEMGYSVISHGLIPDKSPGKTISKHVPAWGPASAVVGLQKVDGSGPFTLSSAAPAAADVIAVAAGAGATA